MELYIKVSFWMGIVALGLNLLSLMLEEYPKTRRETVGFKTVQVLVGGAFVAWSGYLLYA